MTGRDGNSVVLSTLDEMLPSRSAKLWVRRLRKECDEQKEKADRAEEAKAAAVRKSRDARRRVRLATRSLMVASPGIVLSFLGFALALRADGDSRMVLLSMILFVAGTAAFVAAIGLASEQFKKDDENWRARRDSNPRPIA